MESITGVRVIGRVRDNVNLDLPLEWWLYPEADDWDDTLVILSGRGIIGSKIREDSTAGGESWM